MSETKKMSRVAEMFALGTPIDDAIREAVEAAIQEHRRAGRSIVIWRDGQIVELSGDEIDRELERATGAHADPPNGVPR